MGMKKLQQQRKVREGKNRDKKEKKGREIIYDTGNYVKSQIEHFATLLL